MKIFVPKYEINCAYCGQYIKAKTVARIFCNSTCAKMKIYVHKGRKKGRFRKCAFCENEIWVRPNKLKRFKNSFCSREHNILWMKKNAFNFPCKFCGRAIYTEPAQLKLRARSTCSKMCRRLYARHLAEKRREENGYTKHQLDRLARYSIEAEEWRKKVFERDNWTCQICKERGGYLEADHIKPFAFFPELRYELSNGRTLCKPCHNKTKISCNVMRRLYGEPQLEFFLQNSVGKVG